MNLFFITSCGEIKCRNIISRVRWMVNKKVLLYDNTTRRGIAWREVNRNDIACSIGAEYWNRSPTWLTAIHENTRSSYLWGRALLLPHGHRNRNAMQHYPWRATCKIQCASFFWIYLPSLCICMSKHKASTHTHRYIHDNGTWKFRSCSYD